MHLGARLRKCIARNLSEIVWGTGVYLESVLRVVFFVYVPYIHRSEQLGLTSVLWSFILALSLCRFDPLIFSNSIRPLLSLAYSAYVGPLLSPIVTHCCSQIFKSAYFFDTLGVWFSHPKHIFSITVVCFHVFWVKLGPKRECLGANSRKVAQCCC